MNVTLREIDKDNWEAAANLNVDESQKNFVRPNWFSILQVVYAEIDLYNRGIYHDEEMVGYAMMGQDPDDKSGFVGRLMIDTTHQGKGYAKAAMQIIIDDLKARYNPTEIFIRFAPENTVARKLYERSGFTDTGELAHGELVFHMMLTP